MASTVRRFRPYIVEGRKGRFDHIAFVDIDDTMFKTTARIGVRNTKTGEVRSLSNQEFNSYRFGPDEEPDYGEFRDAKKFRDSSRVIESTMKMVKRTLATKGSAVCFLTARSSFDDNAIVRATFRDHGINMSGSDTFIELTGNLEGRIGTVPARKEFVVRKFIDRYGPSSVAMYDDHLGNLKVMDDVRRDYPEVSVKKYLVTAGKIRGVR